jgi:two-component system sensor histidine kinase KdpD
VRRQSSLRSTLSIYALAIFAFIVATGVLFVFRESLTGPVIVLLYLLLVVLVTVSGGLGAGLIIAAVAFLAFNFFFIPPYYTLAVHASSDVIALLVFFIVAVVISQLLGRAHTGLAAATAREQEATHLYELSTALAGLHDERAIAHTLAQQVLDAFHATCVEIGVAQPDATDYVHTLPPGASRPARDPDLSAPLMTARGQQGRVHLWQDDHAMRASEERLLRTFASQGALALERARLSQAETRARVLEESDRMKSALLSSVSHELRTPLATIKAAVSSLRSGTVDWGAPARTELLTAVDEETDYLNLLVGNLLDMTRIESGALQPQREWEILSEIVSGVTHRLRRVTERHRLEVNVPDELPLAPVDHMQMEQVFINLIHNSQKYAPRGTTIRVNARVQDDDGLFVQVSNQGPPVPEEHLEHIFEKFHRVTDADRVTGTGLGLSICKGIIEAHGGRIWAENLPDGFAFNFTLPLTWDGAPPPHLPAELDHT